MGYVSFYHILVPPTGKRGPRNFHSGGKGYGVLLGIRSRGRTNATRNLHFFAELGVAVPPKFLQI